MRVHTWAAGRRYFAEAGARRHATGEGGYNARFGPAALGRSDAERKHRKNNQERGRRCEQNKRSVCAGGEGVVLRYRTNNSGGRVGGLPACEGAFGLIWVG